MGTHRIVGLFYNASRLPKPTGHGIKIGHCDRWSDDVTDDAYNQMVRMPHAFSHERLWRADPLYDLVLITDWNGPAAMKGRGSAIFIHRWRRPRYPTAGCVALHPSDLLFIAKNLRPYSKLIVR